jgi:hypothetical protein
MIETENKDKKIYELTTIKECPSCSSTSFIETDDGNRTQICTTCCFYAIHNGIYWYEKPETLLGFLVRIFSFLMYFICCGYCRKTDSIVTNEKIVIQPKEEKNNYDIL